MTLEEAKAYIADRAAGGAVLVEADHLDGFFLDATIAGQQFGVWAMYNAHGGRCVDLLTRFDDLDAADAFAADLIAAVPNVTLLR